MQPTVYIPSRLLRLLGRPTGWTAGAKETPAPDKPSDTRLPAAVIRDRAAVPGPGDA